MWRQGKKSSFPVSLGVSRGARGPAAAQAAPPAAGGCAGKVRALPGLGLPLTPAVQQVLLAGADSCCAVLARSRCELRPSWARRCTELVAVPGTRAADEARGICEVQGLMQEPAGRAAVEHRAGGLAWPSTTSPASFHGACAQPGRAGVGTGWEHVLCALRGPGYCCWGVSYLSLVWGGPDLPRAAP